MLHARIVETLEALAGDRLTEQVERLASHALRGAVWDKALAYCRQAGEKAMVRSAHARRWGPLSKRSVPCRICQSGAPQSSRPLICGSPCVMRSGR